MTTQQERESGFAESWKRIERGLRPTWAMDGGKITLTNDELREWSQNFYNIGWIDGVAIAEPCKTDQFTG